jgi:predicted RNase H-like HicB family nuclease
MKQFQDYEVVVEKDDNGTFVAHIPEIPGCHAWGETSRQARSELVNVFEMIHEEVVSEAELAASEAAMQDYLAGHDRGISAEELKKLLFGDNLNRG